MGRREQREGNATSQRSRDLCTVLCSSGGAKHHPGTPEQNLNLPWSPRANTPTGNQTELKSSFFHYSTGFIKSNNFKVSLSPPPKCTIKTKPKNKKPVATACAPVKPFMLVCDTAVLPSWRANLTPSPEDPKPALPKPPLGDGAVRRWYGHQAV